MEKYWMAFRNDCEEVTGIKRTTKAGAMNDCKEAFKNDPNSDYYIEQYEDLEGVAVVTDMQLLKMTMGKNGGVHCERKDGAQ